MASDQARQTGPPKRLLSLDGGGVKGVSSLLILQAIMAKVQELEDGSTIVDQTKSNAIVTTTTAEQRELRPIDYFDLAGGTSTGGLIAVMLGRLGMTCTEAIQQYKDLAEEIFSIRFLGINFSKSRILRVLGPLVLKINALFGSEFSSAYLNQAIDHILNDPRFFNPNDPRDPTTGEPYLVVPRYNAYDAKGKMFMCATMADRGKALLFRNYMPPPDAIPETGHLRGDDEPFEPYPANPYAAPAPLSKSKTLLRDFDYKTVTIKDAARATSAAPTYLPPMEIQGLAFWDGGMLNNNPVDQVWSARYDLTPACNDEPYISCVLSLGCTWTIESDNTPVGLISRLFSVLNKSLAFMTNTEAKHMDFKRNIYRRNLRQTPDQQTSYFRFNAPVGKTVVGLADFQKMPFLEEKTRQFLRTEDTKKQILECAKLLVRKKL